MDPIRTGISLHNPCKYIYIYSLSKYSPVAVAFVSGVVSCQPAWC